MRLLRPRPVYDIEVTDEPGEYVARAYFHGSRRIALLVERDPDWRAAVRRVSARLAADPDNLPAYPRTLHADINGRLLTEKGPST